MLSGAPWRHNGSIVRLDLDPTVPVGTVVYDKPRAALTGVVRPGTVLFRGRQFLRGQVSVVEGTAYAYKQGCDPAPYAVRGSYSRAGETITLRGAGPIRQGCDVVGYSEASPHSKLVFTNIIQD